MMPLELSDELLQRIGMTAEETRIEIACWLFDREKLHLWPAAQFAGLSRVEFEGELLERRIPIYRITAEYLEQELRANEYLDRLERESKAKPG